MQISPAQVIPPSHNNCFPYLSATILHSANEEKTGLPTPAFCLDRHIAPQPTDNPTQSAPILYRNSTPLESQTVFAIIYAFGNLLLISFSLDTAFGIVPFGTSNKIPYKGYLLLTFINTSRDSLIPIVKKINERYAASSKPSSFALVVNSEKKFNILSSLICFSNAQKYLCFISSRAKEIPPHGPIFALIIGIPLNLCVTLL